MGVKGKHKGGLVIRLITASFNQVLCWLQHFSCFCRFTFRSASTWRAYVDPLEMKKFD